MAAQVKKVASVLSKALGPQGNNLVKAHAKDETKDSGFIDLPTDMSGAIAQLIECRFELTKADAKQYPNTPMFRAVGIVKVPYEFGGMPVAGLRTQITELICDTTVKSGKSKGEVTTKDQHIANIMNTMRLVSGNENFTAHVTTLDQLEVLAETLETAKPHFRFDTWGGGTYETKDPATGKIIENKSRVNSRWHGYVEFSANGDATHLAGAKDHSEQAGDAEAYANAENAEDQAAAAAAEAAAAQSELPDDPAELAELAAGDADNAGDAGEKLIALAVAAGVEEDAAKGATDWAEVITMMEEAAAAAEEPAAPDPKVGEAWDYHTTMAGGKKSAKPSKGKIVKVDLKKGNVTIKNLLTKKDVVIAISDLVSK
jgi:hypothetical protein